MPYPPAGTTDILARIMSQWLTQRTGQQFVVDNRPGAGNNIGTEIAIKAAPDGYTVFLVNPANAINATLYAKLPFNFLRDMEPVAGLVRVPNVMEVPRAFPAKTVAEFIAHAKEPGQGEHGFFRERHIGASFGRDVQGDDRRSNGSTFRTKAQGRR